MLARSLLKTNWFSESCFGVGWARGSGPAGTGAASNRSAGNADLLYDVPQRHENAWVQEARCKAGASIEITTSEQQRHLCVKQCCVTLQGTWMTNVTSFQKPEAHPWPLTANPETLTRPFVQDSLIEPNPKHCCQQNYFTVPLLSQFS